MKRINDVSSALNLYGISGDFSNGYAKYMGIGHHLYVTNAHDQKTIDEICDKRVHPKEIAKRLGETTNDFKVVVVDAEMGGISLY